MRFLADQDVYASTLRLLAGMGHDVVPVGQLGLARARDAELLAVAHEQARLFITRDRDFGRLVFLEGSEAGVIYLRVLPSTQTAVHAELENVLTVHSEQELQEALVIIEPGGHRLRKPTRKPGQ